MRQENRIDDHLIVSFLTGITVTSADFSVSNYGPVTPGDIFVYEGASFNYSCYGGIFSASGGYKYIQVTTRGTRNIVYMSL